MRFFFADDAKQTRPSRAQMHSLVATGGFSIQAEQLRSLESALQGLCDRTGFPSREEFKWSPPRDSWMYAQLVEDARLAFFQSVVELLAQHDTTTTVVASDTDCETATRAPTHELDVTKLFLERAHWQLARSGSDGVVIVDRPGGGRSDEDRFLLSCVEFLEQGSDYVRPDRFSVNVLSGSSRFSRCLQAADLITSCSLSRISGESRYSPPVFRQIVPLFHRNSWGRIGGTGLKLHPDARLMNLYHWLLGDDVYIRFSNGTDLPATGKPYERDECN